MAGDTDNIVPITSDARSAAEQFGTEHDRQLLTILFTDLVDSTKLQSELGNAEAARLTELHRQIVRDELAKYDAREIEWAGDSCLAVFTKPSDAVVFALRMQMEHLRARKSEPKLSLVRVGITLGEIVVRQREDGGKKTEDLFGLQVSEAARIMSVARGNQIYCSRAVYDSARGSLKGGSDLGETLWARHGLYMLKGSEDPVEICEIGNSELSETLAPEPNDKCMPLGGGAATESSGSGGRSAAKVAIAGIAIVALIGYFVLLGSTPVSAPGEGGERSPQVAGGPVAPREPQPVKRSYLGLSVPPEHPDIAITPDGSSIVYLTRSEVSHSRLAVQEIGKLEGRILENTDSASHPFISPDGQSIGYYDWAILGIVRVPIGGGTPVRIVDDVAGSPWPQWRGDYIHYGATGIPLFRVRAMGGQPEQLTDLRDPAAGGHGVPDVLPGNRGILFTSLEGPDQVGWHTYLAVGDEPPTRLIDSGYAARYIPSGHIVYLKADVPMVAPFDLKSLSIVGEAVRLSDEAVTLNYGFTDAGTLVYFVATDPNRQGVQTLAWVDLAGNETPIPVPAKRYDRLTISPDGDRAVIAASGDIWLLEFDGRAMLQRLTGGAPNDTAPIFAYDGDTIIFSSNRVGNAQLFEMPTEQTAVRTEPAQLSPGGPPRFADAWVPDGERIIFTQLGEETGFDIGVGRLDPSQDVFFRPVVQSSGNEGAVSLSPDGQWVVYTTDEVEGGQLYVSSFPSFEGRYPISIDGGTEPVWAPDGSAIYFRKYPAMMRVDVEIGDTFRADAPVEVFSNPRFFANPQGARSYDVHPDGDRFLMIVPESDSQQQDLYDLVVVENWFDELERIAPHPEAN